MNTVLLGLGSNIGNRAQFIYQALQILDSREDCEVTSVSKLIETEAISTFAQPHFLNGAAICTTLLTPQELLTVTQDIEKSLGRSSKGTNDPRPIDLDILFYNQDVIGSDELIIPHPLLHERHFVLKPLAEIAPGFIHPVLRETVSELYDKLKGY